jgi:pyruvate formate lyase activating enzyme
MKSHGTETYRTPPVAKGLRPLESRERWFGPQIRGDDVSNEKNNRMSDLVIGGLTPLSSVDYPDALAAVVFCQGCPWACPYCHNGALRDATARGRRDWPSVFDWLTSRQGLLDAVVFSGGEPTLQPALGPAMDAVRHLGFRVGLHTSGMFPDALGALAPRCDWVGLDIKAPLAAYDRLTGRPDSGRTAFTSLQRLLAAGLALEVRTTWHPQLLGEPAMLALAGELVRAGARHWVLQAFRPSDALDPDLKATGPTPVPPPLLARLRQAAPGLAVTTRD